MQNDGINLFDNTDNFCMSSCTCSPYFCCILICMELAEAIGEKVELIIVLFKKKEYQALHVQKHQME